MRAKSLVAVIVVIALAQVALAVGLWMLVRAPVQVVEPAAPAPSTAPQRLAEALAATAFRSVITADYASLGEVVRRAAAWPETAFLSVEDSEGRILAHTDGTRVGKTIKEAGPERVSDEPPVSEYGAAMAGQAKGGSAASPGRVRLGWRAAISPAVASPPRPPEAASPIPLIAVIGSALLLPIPVGYGIIKLVARLGEPAGPVHVDLRQIRTLKQAKWTLARVARELDAARHTQTERAGEIRTLQDDLVVRDNQLTHARADLEDRLVEMEQLRTGFGQEREQFAEELTRLSTQLMRANRDAEVLEGQLADAGAELSQTRSDLEHTRTDGQQAQADLEVERTELVRARLDLEQTQASLGQTLSDLGQERMNLGHLRVELEHTQAGLVQAMADLGHERVALGQARADLEQTRADLEQARATVGQAMTDLEEERTTLERTRGELQSARVGLEQALADLGQERATLGQTRGELDSAQASLGQSLADLDLERATLEQTRGELESMRASLGQALEDLRQERAKLDQTRAELESTDTSLGRALADLGQERTILEQTREEAQRTQAGLEQALADLGQERASLEQAREILTQAQFDLGQTRGELERIQTDFAQERETVEQTRAELEQARADVRRVLGERSQTQMELEQVRADLARTQADFGQTLVDLGQERENFEQTRAVLALAQANVGQWQADLAQARIALEQAHADLDGARSAVSAAPAVPRDLVDDELKQLYARAIAYISFAVRGSLTNVLGWSKLLLRESEGPLTDAQRSGVATIQDSGQRLLGLVSDLVDLARIDAKMLDLQEDHVDVPSLVREVVGAGAELLGRKPEAIGVECPSTLPAARGDRQRLRQVLLTLIQEPPGTGAVRLVVRFANQGIAIAVEHPEWVVSKEEAGDLFDPFAPLDPASPVHDDGGRLRLALARSLGTLGGATLTVESRPESGTTFTLTLPAVA
jgi:signal transduction histidine kinase